MALRVLSALLPQPLPRPQELPPVAPVPARPQPPPKQQSPLPLAQQLTLTPQLRPQRAMPKQLARLLLPLLKALLARGLKTPVPHRPGQRGLWPLQTRGP